MMKRTPLILGQFTLLVLLAVGASACGGTAGTAIGDPARGEELYNTEYEEAGPHACSDCHKLAESSTFAPSFVGISERASESVEGMSAEEYLRESIVDPTAYLVEGYVAPMPRVYGDILSEEDINDLIAFMLTQ
jgi:cytochrome c2